jgi:hypothetical protein
MHMINARIIEHNKFTFHYFISIYLYIYIYRYIYRYIYIYMYTIRDILWHFTKLISTMFDTFSKNVTLRHVKYPTK